MSLNVKMTMMPIIMFAVRLLITIYTYVTLPYYYWSQKPWHRLKRAHRCRARLEVPTDAANSAWICNGPKLTHPVIRPTVTEILNNLVKYHGHDTPILAYREVLSADKSMATNGKCGQLDNKPVRTLRLGDYKWLTYGRVDTITTSLARGLAANGAHFGDKILILSETRVEWFLWAQAVAKLGACIVTLSPNLGDEGLAYGINQTEIKLMIVSGECVPKIRSLITQIPTVRTIVYINLNNFQLETDSKCTPGDQITGFPDTIQVLSMREVELKGVHRSDIALQTPEPDDPFVIIYTSGSTGAPKAAVATHRQMVNGSANSLLSLFKDIIADGTGSHTYVAFLPLCHVFELTIEFFLYYVGVKIGYATTSTLTESGAGLAPGVPSDVSLLRPTVMICVPLMLDRILKDMGARLTARSPLAVPMFTHLMAYKSYWTERGYRCPIVDKLVCDKLRQQMGGALLVAIVGAAPLSPTTQATLRAALDIALLQVYGTTETTGCVFAMDHDDLSISRVGAPLQGMRIKLIDWEEGGYYRSDRPNPRGEIVIGGDSVVTEYYKLAEQTREAFWTDDRGCRWFYTGDIGEIFPDGTVGIIDRRKDLLKLQSGRYVSLGQIEAALKLCQYVDNICVCGDGYSNELTALVSPNRLHLRKLADELGLNGANVGELCQNPDLRDRFYRAIVGTGLLAGIPAKEIPVRICLVPDEWTVDNDLMTAAMKTKRKAVERRYCTEIDALFGR